MPKYSLHLIVGCVFVFSPILFGGDGAGHGGGSGEKILALAAVNLESNLVRCQNSKETCGLNGYEIELLGRLIKSVNQNPISTDQMVFISETQSPGTFILPDKNGHGGTVRSAVTGSRLGGKIWINTDHLYFTNRLGKQEPIGLSLATALLVDEVAHHIDNSFRDAIVHLKLDVFAAKIAGCLSRHMTHVEISPYGDLAATIIGDTPGILFKPELQSMKTSISQFILDDGFGNFREITPQIKEVVLEKFPCWRSRWESPRPLSQFVIYDVHKHRPPQSYFEVPREHWCSERDSPKMEIYPIHARVRVSCAEVIGAGGIEYDILIKNTLGTCFGGGQGVRRPYWPSEVEIEVANCNDRSDSKLCKE